MILVFGFVVLYLWWLLVVILCTGQDLSLGILRELNKASVLVLSDISELVRCDQCCS